MKAEKNCLNDGVRKLNGKKIVDHSKELDFNAIKESSKALGITINDLFTAAVSVGVKKYFKKRNDPSENL